MKLNQLKELVAAGAVSEMAFVPDSASNCYHLRGTLQNGKGFVLDAQRGAPRGFKSTVSINSVLRELTGTPSPLTVNCFSKDQAELQL